jgi:hypothetical protein
MMAQQFDDQRLFMTDVIDDECADFCAPDEAMRLQAARLQQASERIAWGLGQARVDQSLGFEYAGEHVRRLARRAFM